MEQILMFSALLQAALVTAVLGKKACKQDLPNLLLFLLMVNYSCVLFLNYWNMQSSIQLSKIHMPISYASGPIFYYFVRFSFLPVKNIKKYWLWWFAPLALELILASSYWLLFAVASPFAQIFETILKTYQKLSFPYFIAFFIAAIVFLIQNKTMLTMNIVYKKQFVWLKYMMFFIFLFILDETISTENDGFYSSLLACSFTSTFVFALLANSQLFFKQNNESKELLKEALNEQTKAVVITNADKVVEYVNEAFLTIIGYRHRDVIGRKLSFLRGDLTTPASMSYMREKLEERVEFEIDIVNYRKNNEAYVCHIRIMPVFSDKGLTHFIAYEEDIKTILAAHPQDEDMILLEKIRTYFIKEEPFKNQHLQVADIAENLGISPRRVGEILKTCANQSFSEFVNTHRVRAAVSMLQNSNYQHLTVEAIGQMCGFNSKSVFHIAFKKIMGKTPTMFLEGLTNVSKATELRR
jgi:PAS domain S-box-containing protein